MWKTCRFKVCLEYNAVVAVSSKRGRNGELYCGNICWSMNPKNVEVHNVEIISLIKHEAMAGWKDKRLEKQRSSTQ